MKTICIFENGTRLMKHMAKQKIGYEIRHCNNFLENFLYASLVVIYEDSINLFEEIMQKIKSQNVPTIVFSESYNPNYLEKCTKSGVIYCCEHLELLFNAISSILSLYDYAKTSNPLTGLPGNNSIERELIARINSDEDFTVLYLDLDNFKPYNDKYGFLKGDSILQYTSQVIRASVRSTDFVGHIGGDDFIVILSGNSYTNVCKRIISNFDNGIKAFFEDETIREGSYYSFDRAGIYKPIPITTISIGVVPINVLNRVFYPNIGTIAEAGTLMKKAAKEHSHSYFSVKD